MSWIKEIDYNNADNQLKKLYDRVKGPNNNVDNILTVQSLRPHSLLGHLTLYKNVLHNSNNTLPKWYLETIGVYISHLNKCTYCVDHHSEGLKRLLNNKSKFDSIINSIYQDNFNNSLKTNFRLGLLYSKKLTTSPSNIQENDIAELRDGGFTDGEILEINQVVSYFNYANRTVLGLGVNSKDDILGLSPNDSNDPTNWKHT
ncbi:MAG: peroxidase-related enzyme [Bacteroidetes bacterium]|nr:peroxidase-related enzyme [Bacteroidota bacterium]